MRISNVFMMLAAAAVATSCGESTPTGKVSISGDAGVTASALSLEEDYAPSYSEEDVFDLIKTTGIDPSEVNIGVYGVFVSESATCENPVKIFYSDTKKLTDFTAGVELGKADASAITWGEDETAKTYKCVMITMSDSITYKPKEDSDNGACVTTTAGTLNVCNNYGDENSITTSTLLKADANGAITSSTVTCSSAEDIVTLYLSTESTSTGGESDADGSNAFQAPTASNKVLGIKLEGAGWIVSRDADTNAKFEAKFAGRVQEREDNGQYSCDVLPPTFGFQ